MPGHGAYASADSHGYFEPLNPLDLDDEFHHAALEVDDLNVDLAERGPGSAAAKAVDVQVERFGPWKAWQAMWLPPVLLFLVALFVQSIGLYKATYRYIQWNAVEQKDFGVSGSNLDVRLPDNLLSQVLGISAQTPETETATDGFCSAALAGLWFGVVFWSGNLRLWTRLMLTAAGLAALKSLIAQTTVLPDAGGISDCRDRLGQDLYSHFMISVGEAGLLDWFSGIGIVFQLWFASLVTGLRGHRHLVCADQLLSGPTYLSVIFSCGLYDFAREKCTRKRRPLFRRLLRSAAAAVLTLLVLADAVAELASHRRYTLDLTLSMCLGLLLYGSPLVSVLTTRWITRGRDHEDDGDVLVPLCCVPLCCVQGRYYLSQLQAEQASARLKKEEEKQKKAEAELAEKSRRRINELWREEEESSRKLLHLRALADTREKRSRNRAEQQQAALIRRRQQAKAEIRQASDAKFQRERKALLTRLYEDRLAAGQSEVESERIDFQAAATASDVARQDVAALRAKLEQPRTVASPMLGSAHAELSPLPAVNGMPASPFPLDGREQLVPHHTVPHGVIFSETLPQAPMFQTITASPETTAHPDVLPVRVARSPDIAVGDVSGSPPASSRSTG